MPKKLDTMVANQVYESFKELGPIPDPEKEPDQFQAYVDVLRARGDVAVADLLQSSVTYVDEMDIQTQQARLAEARERPRRAARKVVTDSDDEGTFFRKPVFAAGAVAVFALLAGGLIFVLRASSSGPREGQIVKVPVVDQGPGVGTDTDVGVKAVPSTQVQGDSQGGNSDLGTDVPSPPGAAGGTPGSSGTSDGDGASGDSASSGDAGATPADQIGVPAPPPVVVSPPPSAAGSRGTSSSPAGSVGSAGASSTDSGVYDVPSPPPVVSARPSNPSVGTTSTRSSGTAGTATASRSPGTASSSGVTLTTPPRTATGSAGTSASGITPPVVSTNVPQVATAVGADGYPVPLPRQTNSVLYRSPDAAGTTRTSGTAANAATSTGDVTGTKSAAQTGTALLARSATAQNTAPAAGSAASMGSALAVQRSASSQAAAQPASQSASQQGSQQGSQMNVAGAPAAAAPTASAGAGTGAAGVALQVMAHGPADAVRASARMGVNGQAPVPRVSTTDSASGQDVMNALSTGSGGERPSSSLLGPSTMMYIRTPAAAAADVAAQTGAALPASAQPKVSESELDALLKQAGLGAAPAAPAAKYKEGDYVPVTVGEQFLVSPSLGIATPVILRGDDGVTFLGQATLQGNRVIVGLSRMIVGNAAQDVNVSLIGEDGGVGLPVKVATSDPTIVNRLVNSALSATSTYVDQMMQGNSVVSYRPDGSIAQIATTNQKPNLLAVLLGSVSSVFKQPAQQQAPQQVISATVPKGVKARVVFLPSSASQAAQAAGRATQSVASGAASSALGTGAGSLPSIPGLNLK